MLSLAAKKAKDFFAALSTSEQNRFRELRDELLKEDLKHAPRPIDDEEWTFDGAIDSGWDVGI